jgi:hypothetical protein
MTKIYHKNFAYNYAPSILISPTRIQRIPKFQQTYSTKKKKLKTHNSPYELSPLSVFIPTTLPSIIHIILKHAIKISETQNPETKMKKKTPQLK